ncbi:MAG: sigma-54 dependent transcriptional regulator [Proteobacteria bacterium]|nr:sigma-54 dependent transcriptional regulator [Pseudomonadota bacterium]
MSLPIVSFAATNSNNCLVIVDDQQDFSKGMARLVSGHFADLEVIATTSGKEALTVLRERAVHLMITDLRMPEMSGMQLLNEALKIHPEICMVVLTAYGTIETAVAALQAGAYDFLTKPIDPEQLFRVIEKGLERCKLLEENNRLRQMLAQQDAQADLVGIGPAMQHLKRTIAAVAQSDYSVLIRGESGTGKELVARLVHHLGARAAKPFLAVNCPAIPENLLESELFGYVKGAFTGADKDHKGLLAAADGGTLHLDEIGDISPAIQTKLLRCLQDGEIRPVGSNHCQRVDVRVIASTNQDLETSLRDKRFREDLFYRLNVLPVFLAPLRERPEDIPLLAKHFLQGACREMSLAEKEIDQEVLQWLAAETWPGNVRELQNFVRRLTVYCSGTKIDMGVVQHVQGTGLQPVTQTTLCNTRQTIYSSYKEAKAEIVKVFTSEYIQTLLTQTKGNISEAARVSGLSRVALQKILARTGENAGRFRE